MASYQSRRPRPEGKAQGRRYTPRRRVCGFCADKIDYIDYKQVDRLRRYLTDRAKIAPRRRSGLCAKHQRAVTEAIKWARHVALLPFTAEHFAPGASEMMRR